MKHFFFGCVVLFFAIDSTAAYKVPVEPLQQFDVADYGAVSNDGLQDHTAINAAIDAACAVGGGIIKLEPGAIYHIGSASPSNRFYTSVQIDCSNITLTTPFGGEQAQFRPLDPDGNVMIVVASGQSLVAAPTNPTEIENTTISNIVLHDDDPEAHASTIEESHGIYVGWSKNTLIERVTCSSIGDECFDLKGDLDGGTQKYVSDITIQDIYATNSPSLPSGGHVIVAMNTKDAVFQRLNCSGAAKNTTSNSAWLSRSCVMLWSLENGIPTENITIRDSVFSGYYTDAIYIAKTNDNISNVLISNNTFRLGWSNGMTITTSASEYSVVNLIIDGNSFSGPGLGVNNKSTADIGISATDGVISDNVIDGTTATYTELGTSTGTTMEVTGAGWAVNEWAGHWIECTSGTCADQKFLITGNDADTLTINGTWSGGTPNSVTFRLMYHSAVIINGATATGGSSNTIVDSGAGWTVNAYANMYVNIDGGTCSGQTLRIASNTSDTITTEGTSTWSACTPDATSVFDVQTAMNEAYNSAVVAAGTSMTISGNRVKNFPGGFVDVSIASLVVDGNSAVNVGIAARDAIFSSYTANNTDNFMISNNSIVLDSAGIDVVDTSSWSNADSILVSNNRFVGTANGYCISGSLTIVSGNHATGCYYGVSPVSANVVIAENVISPTNRGMYVGNVLRPIISNNQIIEAGATAIDLAGTTDYAVMIGNRSYHSSTTREIECSTLNGGVGANDVCLGNWDGNGVKDTLSTLGAKITSGTTPPATCTVGEIFNDTDATAADQLLSCTATDTWTAQ